MRILVLSNLYPNPYQPHRATFNRNQIRCLAKKHQVRVIAPIAWTDELKAKRSHKPSLPKDRQVHLDGIVVDHPRYWFPPKVLRGQYGRFYRASVRKTFDRVLNDFRPEVIYTPWAYPDGWAAVELGRRAAVPVVLKVHGSDVLLLSRFPARRAATAHALRRADTVIAVSRDLLSQVVRLGTSPERVTVIYDGVDTTVFRRGSRVEARNRLNLSDRKIVLLSIGNLVPVKGHSILIDACAHLSRNGVEFNCFIFGDGPLRARLQEQISAHALQDRIKLMGSLPQQQLADWYRACDLFLLPSYSEGVPNVLLEAAACGAAFVASSVGGIPEIAHLACSILVRPGEAAVLAAGIERALRDDFDPSSATEEVRDVTETVSELERSLAAVCVRPSSAPPDEEGVDVAEFRATFRCQ